MLVSRLGESLRKALDKLWSQWCNCPRCFETLNFRCHLIGNLRFLWRRRSNRLLTGGLLLNGRNRFCWWSGVLLVVGHIVVPTIQWLLHVSFVFAAVLQQGQDTRTAGLIRGSLLSISCRAGINGNRSNNPVLHQY